MDPNQLLPGVPAERWVWLAPDWSASKPAAAATGLLGDRPPVSGYTKVKVRDLRYVDGRVVTVVLNEDGQPVGPDGQPTTPEQARVLEETTDDDQAKRHKDQQDAAARPTPTRNINGVPHQVVGKDANGQDIWAPVQTAAGAATAAPTGTNPASQGASSQITGTPTAYDAQGRPTAWDNTRPVRLWTRPDGSVVGTPQPLTGEERATWERQKNQQAGLGAKTDAEVEKDKPQTGESKGPVEGYPGWTVIKRKKVEGGNTTEVTTFIGPDGKEVSSLPGRPGAATLKPDGKGGTVAVQTMPDGTIQTTPVPGVPSDRPQPEKVTINGQVWERDPQTGQYSPAKGLPTLGQATANVPPMPQLMPQAVTQALIQYHADLAKNPNLTPEQRVKAFDDFRQIASMAITQWTNEQNERESVRHDQYNRAGSVVTARYNAMQQALGFVDKISGTVTAESGLAGKAFVALLGINAINLATSGLQSPPSVKAPTLGPGDLSNAAALEAKRQEVLAASQAAQGAAAAPSPFEPGSGISETTDRGGVPRVYEPSAPSHPLAGSPPPTAGEPGGPPLQPGPVWTPPASGGGEPSRANVPTQAPAAGNERPDDILTIRNTDGTVVVTPRSAWDTYGPSQADWTVVNAESGSLYRHDPAAGRYVRREAPPAANPYLPPSTTVTSGTGVSPYPGAPVNVPYPTQPTDQSLQSVPDFAVLQTPNATAAKVSAPTPYAPMDSFAVLGQQAPSFTSEAADLHQQAAATVPWRMTPEQLDAYRRAGVPEDAILAVPGGW
jgi:hypothetical protein